MKMVTRKWSKKVSMAVLISGKKKVNKSKTIFKTKNIIMIKWSIQWEDLTVIYIPNIRELKYIKQIFTHVKEKSDNSTIVFSSR